MPAVPTTTAPAYSLHGNDLLLGEYIDQYILRVRDLPEEQKPREKLARLGPRHLSVAELVAAILGVGTRKEEVLTMAQRIVREYGEKSIAAQTNPAKMAAALNLPFAKACQIIAAFELGRRFFASEAGKALYIRSASQAYEHLQHMCHANKEQLRGLYLNSRYELIHDEVISIGSLTANIVHPREVFRPAIEHGAVAVIIAHNHPSGSLEPTAEDLLVTDQLAAAGRLLGIELLDHLIVVENRFIRITREKSHA
jgi:DNA repair protein RadC